MGFLFLDTRHDLYTVMIHIEQSRYYYTCDKFTLHPQLVIADIVVGLVGETPQWGPGVYGGLYAPPLYPGLKHLCVLEVVFFLFSPKDVFITDLQARPVRLHRQLSLAQRSLATDHRSANAMADSTRGIPRPEPVWAARLN